MNAKIRITVVKRLFHKDLADEHCTHEWKPCNRLSDGQEFVSEGANMPEGFCSWAWADIQKYVLTLARGGNLLGVKEGRFVTCCTDGFRPVVFTLERIESPSAD
ncbi:MAG: TIGR04076 family protein [Planctomycetota bacterium]